MDPPERRRLELGELDLGLGVFHRADGPRHLTLHQLELLRYLVERAGTPVSRDELLKNAWGWRGRVLHTRATDFAIRRIRAVIERDPAKPRHLLTQAGVGYRFEPLSASTSAPGHPLQPPGARFDAHWYAPRPVEERRAAEHLAAPGAPAVFTAPRGFGKTWLMHQVLSETVRPEDTGVEVNVESWEASTRKSTDAVAWQLALAVAEAVELADSQLASAWARPGDSFFRLTRLLERDVLPNVVGRLILVVDHADLLASVPDGSALFGLLRAWASRPRSPWEKLRLVLAVSTEPALLVEVPELSPFNLSVPISVPPFDDAQVAELARRHHLGPGVVAPTLALTGGHPTLVRLALHDAAARGVEIAEVAEDGTPYLSHLESRARRLRASPTLLEAVRALAADRAPLTDPAERLVTAGIFRRVSGGYRFQNRLYEQFLPRWLG